MPVSEPQLAEILKSSKTIAVVGLSPDPSATSHEVSAYLQRAGYRIIPVHPTATQVLGEKAWPALKDLPEPADIVDVFRRSEFIAEVAREVVALPWKPRLVFVQLGIRNAEGRAIVETAGIPYVEDRCIKIEHRRLVK
jgi:hypothetical protein